MVEQETVNGFDIPIRKLTEEEQSRDITLQRFKEFHYSAGEDFLDTTSEGDAKIFAGYLLHKYPKLSKDILDIVNEKGKYLEIRSFVELEPLDYNDKEDIEMLYQDFSDFCNLTEHLKRRVNQVLIQVKEYYND
jgi:hypothetical protein